ncbi:hypothetical protein MWU59_10030 [Flavobacteriaceae bacterium F08102]|nr:hypothetical protein [Flavobacteriaceae bacterium F08102]
MKINKPIPIVSRREIILFNRYSNISDTLSELEAENSVLITAFYNNGLLLLKELHTHLKAKLSSTSFQEQRHYRATYHTLSNRILLEIKDHTIVVKKLPVIGWLKELYPDLDDFLLSLPQIHRLNSSWQWYQKGISIPVLRNRLHPYYGT